PTEGARFMLVVEDAIPEPAVANEPRHLHSSGAALHEHGDARESLGQPVKRRKDFLFELRIVSTERLACIDDDAHLVRWKSEKCLPDRVELLQDGTRVLRAQGATLEPHGFLALVHG